MIRINLLGVTKSKGKRGAPAAAAVSMGMPSSGSPMIKVAAAMIVLAVLNGGYWFVLDKQKRDIAAQMAVAERKNRELSEVKARYLERQREAENYKRRVDVIDQLRAGQSGPVNLMNTVGDTVNKTEAVWLNTMKDAGNSIDLEGYALSSDAVANLIANLQKTGYFKTVEIKESAQDASIKEMQAFLFTLTCEKGGTGAASAAGAAPDKSVGKAKS
jgi:type IV pilus assembly protein PilN